MPDVDRSPTRTARRRSSSLGAGHLFKPVASVGWVQLLPDCLDRHPGVCIFERSRLVVPGSHKSASPGRHSMSRRVIERTLGGRHVCELGTTAVRIKKVSNQPATGSRTTCYQVAIRYGASQQTAIAAEPLGRWRR